MDPGVQSRLKGRFDQVASTYAANRPDYPATAAGWLLGGQVSDVLDLAAGSGSLTRALAARASRVVAAEPARNLLRELRRSDPRIPAARANAEAVRRSVPAPAAWSLRWPPPSTGSTTKAALLPRSPGCCATAAISGWSGTPGRYDTPVGRVSSDTL